MSISLSSFFIDGTERDEKMIYRQTADETRKIHDNVNNNYNNNNHNNNRDNCSDIMDSSTDGTSSYGCCSCCCPYCEAEISKLRLELVKVKKQLELINDDEEKEDKQQLYDGENKNEILLLEESTIVTMEEKNGNNDDDDENKSDDNTDQQRYLQLKTQQNNDYDGNTSVIDDDDDEDDDDSINYGPQDQQPQQQVDHIVSKTTTTTATEFQLNGAIEAMKSWVFLEANLVKDVKTFVLKYIKLLGQLNFPCDRLFYGGAILEPLGIVCGWKWSRDNPDDVQGHEFPTKIYNEMITRLGKDTPFIRLHDERLPNGERLPLVRIRPKRKDEHIPNDCKWLVEGGYTDYVALPFWGQDDCSHPICKSAWSTKHPNGFSTEQINFLQQTMAGLSTVIKMQSNEKIKNTILERMQKQINEQTQSITDANSKLLKANVAIKTQSKKQLQHFASMSHEIRTPLNCIINLSDDLLKDEELQSRITESERECIEMIARSGDLLLGVVNDVLEFSRLESGHLDIDICKGTDLLSTLKTVVHAMRFKAKDRGIQVKTNFDDGTTCTASNEGINFPRYVATDARRLQQIFFNLVGNAVKFSQNEGIVEFTASSLRYVEEESKEEHEEEKRSDAEETCRRQQRQVIEFVVKDYGRGIERCDIDAIFEPFNQASRDTQALYGGTGLGLSITNKLVKGLDGEISADSEYGHWTKFIVKIPFFVATTTTSSSSSTTTDEQQRRQQTTGESTSNENSSSHKQTITATTNICDNGALTSPSYNLLRVLVADDNIINQKVLKRSLQRLGIQHIDVANNGQEAVDLVLNNKYRRKATETYHQNGNNEEQQHGNQNYNYVFMDAEMPVMDGWEAAKIITATANTSADNPLIIPPKIIFVTAHAMEQFQEKANQVGADGFVSKPFKINDIRQVLKMHHHHGMN